MDARRRADSRRRLAAAGDGGRRRLLEDHTYQELSAELKAIVAANPTIARIASIGKTREGRDIWAVELANLAGTLVDQRPGLLVAANIEGDHLIGSELALFMVDALTKGYAADAAIKQRLDTGVIYVVPRVNPDGAELMFAPVKALRRTNTTPFDADNDGRTDEDGPEDLNKDGVITLMRVKDPKGPYMVSPDDPRLMKRADPAKGESGGWALYWEGLDKDNDGSIAEDGPGGADINRNFMHQYPYLRAGRRSLHGERGGDARDARVHAEAPEYRGHRHFGESDNLIATPSRRSDLAAANRSPDRLRRPHADRRAPRRHVPGHGRRRPGRPRRRRRGVRHGGRRGRTGRGGRAGRRRQGGRPLAACEHDDCGRRLRRTSASSARETAS